MSILLAFLVIALLGLLLGLGLAFADKKFAVKKDEKLLKLEAIMPGANCGGCGYPGCQAYAAAVASGEAPIGLCAPGGAKLNVRMGEIMGVDAPVNTEKMVAFVFCDGSSEVTKEDFSYDGIEDCNAASLIHGGFLSCKQGCLRLGSCIKVCPVNAIYKNEKGQIIVDKEKCIGCKKCTLVCPNQVIRMRPYKDEYVVPCNNREMGAKVKKACQVGCIGCKICQLKFPDSGCIVEDNLCYVYQDKVGDGIEGAMEKCPSKCIKKR